MDGQPGRPPKITSAHDIAYIRSNPDNLSNKELAAKFNVGVLTIIKVKNKRGAYAEARTV